VLFPTYVVCLNVSLMNVVYREKTAAFLHPYKTYILSIEDNVMNVLYREISAVFLHTYTV
jgi:hypothetical protein